MVLWKCIGQFNKFPNQSLDKDGILLLTQTGKYQGKLLSTFADAKGVCLSNSKCDGLMKQDGHQYYDLFTLKTKINNVIKTDSTSTVYIKDTCKLGN